MCNHLTWPGATYDQSGEDLCAPTTAYLECLALVEKPDELEENHLLTTPESVQVIKAGATAMSKGWATGIAGTGLAASYVGFLRIEWGGAGDLVKSTFIISVAVLLAAVVVSIAKIVCTDVTTRGAATAQRVTARTSAANTFLELTAAQQSERRVAPAAQSSNGHGNPPSFSVCHHVTQAGN